MAFDVYGWAQGAASLGWLPKEENPMSALDTTQNASPLNNLTTSAATQNSKIQSSVSNSQNIDAVRNTVQSQEAANDIKNAATDWAKISTADDWIPKKSSMIIQQSAKNQYNNVPTPTNINEDIYAYKDLSKPATPINNIPEPARSALAVTPLGAYLVGNPEEKTKAYDFSNRFNSVLGSTVGMVSGTSEIKGAGLAAKGLEIVDTSNLGSKAFSAVERGYRQAPSLSGVEQILIKPPTELTNVFSLTKEPSKSTEYVDNIFKTLPKSDVTGGGSRINIVDTGNLGNTAFTSVERGYKQSSSLNGIDDLFPRSKSESAQSTGQSVTNSNLFNYRSGDPIGRFGSKTQPKVKAVHKTLTYAKRPKVYVGLKIKEQIKPKYNIPKHTYDSVWGDILKTDNISNKISIKSYGFEGLYSSLKKEPSKKKVSGKKKSGKEKSWVDIAFRK